LAFLVAGGLNLFQIEIFRAVEGREAILTVQLPYPLKQEERDGRVRD